MHGGKLPTRLEGPQLGHHRTRLVVGSRLVLTPTPESELLAEVLPCAGGDDMWAQGPTVSHRVTSLGADPGGSSIYGGWFFS